LYENVKLSTNNDKPSLSTEKLHVLFLEMTLTKKQKQKDVESSSLKNLNYYDKMEIIIDGK
jgi:hypothetical protein